MNQDQLAKLREPFGESQIGKKPQVNCGACTQATKNARRSADKHCERHTIVKCPTCQAYITTGHIHLDFVGHAVTTSRLLSVDPDWTWEPMGYDSQGLPATDPAGNLWIWLTVAGVRKPGVGDGVSAKEAVGDAIRNAAMRFGVALELWAKQDLDAAHAPVEEVVEAPVTLPEVSPLQEAKTRAWNALRALHPSWDNARLLVEMDDQIRDVLTKHRDEVTADEWAGFAEQWEQERDEVAS